MLKEINLEGIFIAPFVGFLVMAVFIFIPIRILFDRYEIQRWVWHRQLFDISIFIILLSLIGLMF